MLSPATGMWNHLFSPRSGRNNRRPARRDRRRRDRGAVPAVIERLEERVLLSGFSFTDFSNASDLNLVGYAAVTPENVLRLTPARGSQQGGAWYSAEKQYVSVEFQTTFQFRMNEGSDGPNGTNGSDGFVFAIQNTGTTFLGGGGLNLGYGGLANSLVVEFDTFQNYETNDPSHSHISVHSNGTGANGPHESFALGTYNTVAAGFLLDDAQVHTARISYVPGTLSVFLDNLTTPVLTVSVNLAQTLNLDAGQAWVGFTAATGGGWQNHDILDWDFQTVGDIPSVLSIGDVSQIEGNAGTSAFVFTVTRQGDSTGTSTANWATSNGTANAPSDYVAASGQVSFLPGETQRTISVNVKGDTLQEAHETFFVTLSNPGNAVIGDGQGIGTILNDDASLAVSDATVTEGNATYQFTDHFVAPDGYGLAAARNLVIGPDGNVYVASEDSDVVKVFEAGTGRFVRDLGTAGGELDGPWGLVFGPDGRLYVGGRYSRNIVRFNIADGSYSVFVSSASGGLGAARSLAFGPTGDLFVSSRVEAAPTTSDTVKRFHGATGAYLGDFVTAGSGRLNNANAIAFGPDGNLYVASTTSRQILRYNGQTGAFLNVFVTVAAEAGPPNFFMFHTDGGLYVAGNNNSLIHRYDAVTGASQGQFVSGPNSTPVRGMAFTSTGELYVSSGTSILVPGSSVMRFAPASTVAFTVSLSQPAGGPVSVNYVTADGTATAANDYVAASGTITFAPGETTRTILVATINNAIYEPNETFTIVLSNPTAGATISDGLGVATIVDDDLPPTKFYIVDAGADDTFEYGATGTLVENYNLGTGNTDPRGAAADATGQKVWVIDSNMFVYVYNPAGGLLGSWKAKGLNTPEGIATNGTDIWIVDRGSDKVFFYAGGATRLSGNANATSNFALNSGNKDATGITTDGTHIWVVNDAATNKVFRYTTSGALVGSWTIDSANSTPTGITIDPANPQHLWIVDSGTDRVYQYDNAVTRTSGSQTASTSFALAAGNGNPQGIADPPPAAAMESGAVPSGEERASVPTTAAGKSRPSLPWLFEFRPSGAGAAAFPSGINGVTVSAAAPPTLQRRDFIAAKTDDEFRIVVPVATAAEPSRTPEEFDSVFIGNDDLLWDLLLSGRSARSEARFCEL